MRYNFNKLFLDLKNKMDSLNIGPTKLSFKQGFSKETYYRIKNSKPIHNSTFVIVVKFIDTDPDKYLIKN